MVKRVSLKGKGADLFFGDYLPDQVAESEAPSEQASNERLLPTPTDVTVSAVPLPVERSETRRPRATSTSKKVSKKESTLARMQEDQSDLTRVLAGMPPGAEPEPPSAFAQHAIEGIWSSVVEPATLTNAFRYTEQELTGLNDAAYEVTKANRVKLSKQDIARLGLNVVLWDYRAHGEESLLSQFVRRRKQQRQGE